MAIFGNKCSFSLLPRCRGRPVRDHGEGEAGVQEMPLHQMPLDRDESEICSDGLGEEDAIRKVFQEERRDEKEEGDKEKKKYEKVTIKKK